MFLWKPKERSERSNLKVKPRRGHQQRREQMVRDEKRMPDWRAVVDDEHLIHIRVR